MARYLTYQPRGAIRLKFACPIINVVNRLGSARVGGRTLIMGVLNASPESFYRGSVRQRGAGAAARRLASKGAHVIDVGGMSSAPYLGTFVTEREEARRVVGAVRAARASTNLPVSVDTSRASVARAALDAGASIINDVSGLKHDPLMCEVVSSYSPSLVLCAHGREAPAGDPVLAAKKLLKESLNIAADAGARKDRIVLDPSVGFFRRSGRGRLFTRIRGDWFARDLEIIEGIGRVGFPVMASVSRKSVAGKMFGAPNPALRGEASAALEAACVLAGADALRTHDPDRSAAAASAARRARDRRPSTPAARRARVWRPRTSPSCTP